MGKKKGGNRKTLGADLQAGAGAGTSSPASLVASRSRVRSRAQGIESRFSKLNGAALENLNLIATYTRLRRPIPEDARYFHPSHMGSVSDAHNDSSSSSSSSTSTPFKLPKKPRWHHDLTAKAVQSNEDSVFQDWLSATDAIMQEQFPLAQQILSSPIEVRHLPSLPDRSQCLLPSLFERNVQVYRQLWRVIEQSNLLLVLVDARCPLLHLPPSLESHLQRYASMRTILVLTKKDIVGDDIAQQWKTYLEHRYQWPVVVTESYKREARQEGQGKRSRFTPFLSPESRTALFAAIRAAHARLVTPPQRVRDDPEQRAKWQPPCNPSIDWDDVERGRDAERDVDGGAGPSAPTPSSPSPFTIGLIGQPNVGKSSLLNALIGSKVVRASRTPGKTKHFQTHRLGRGVLLCDSPGLVFPSRAGQELQVLGAILPISQVQAITTVVRFVADHMPLEDVLNLQLPPDEDGIDESKGEWTAAKVLEALCRRHGYKTAKAGRWDLNRAGNALARSLAEGRIKWAFQPPPETAAEAQVQAGALGDDTDHTADSPSPSSRGIWLGHEGSAESASILDDDDGDGEDDSDGGEDDEKHRATSSTRKPRNNQTKSVSFDLSDVGDDDDENDDASGDDEDDGVPAAPTTATSMFNALAVEGADDDDDENSDSDEREDNDGENARATP